MELQIKNEKENPYLKRKELDVIITHQGQATPRREEVREAIAKQLGVGKEYVEVERIMSVKGEAKSVARVYVHEEPIAQEKPAGESKGQAEAQETGQAKAEGAEASEEEKS